MGLFGLVRMLVWRRKRNKGSLLFNKELTVVCLIFHFLLQTFSTLTICLLSFKRYDLNFFHCQIAPNHSKLCQIQPALFFR